MFCFRSIFCRKLIIVMSSKNYDYNDGCYFKQSNSYWPSDVNSLRGDRYISLTSYIIEGSSWTIACIWLMWIWPQHPLYQTEVLSMHRVKKQSWVTAGMAEKNTNQQLKVHLARDIIHSLRGGLTQSFQDSRADYNWFCVNFCMMMFCI